MNMRNTFRKAVIRLKDNKKKLVVLYATIIAILFSAMYYYWRSEFSWREIWCMSQLKILFENYDVIQSLGTSDDVTPQWSIAAADKYQTFSSTFYDSHEQKFYCIDFRTEQELLYISISSEKAYTQEFNDEVTIDFDAWNARNCFTERSAMKDEEVIKLIKLTLPSENTQVTPVEGKGYLIVSSVSTPLIPALKSVLLWHVTFMIMYVFYRYITWARKTILSERQKVRIMHRDMMNAIAHEIRTPLAAIMGYTENLKLGIREDKKDWYLDKISEKGNQIDHMIDDILSLAKMEEAGTLSREIIIPDQILADCMQEYPEVQFVIEKKNEWQITADSQYISRMFRCLLDNAVKYRTEGTPVSVYCDAGDIRIHNMCEPLREEHLKNLFEFHANKDGRYSFGLYFAYKAAEKSGLKLHLYNDNDGVTVQIS